MRSLRTVWVVSSVLAVTALSGGAAGAADKTKVDAATKQVEQGAKQVAHGQVGPGVKETAKGIGNTVVEGTKYSGENIKKFFHRPSAGRRSPTDQRWNG